MGQIKEPSQVLLIVAAFSAEQDYLSKAQPLLENKFSKAALVSADLPFGDTQYYAPTMGTNLSVRIFAFERLIAPDQLAETKCVTNALEDEMAATSAPVARPLNLDPGYLTLSKFVLATTKDGGHRIYLKQGIYAEVTLQYSHGAWQENPWTYPNYTRDDYKTFLRECRDYYRQQRDTHPHDPLPR